MSINKIAWLTDIHLNFLKYNARIKFYQSITNAGSDIVLITGDIAEATNLCEILSEFSTQTNMPIYFVLGNHDYYSSSVANVRKKIVKLCTENANLIWLGKPEIVVLNDYTALIGHDGWADARYGDFDHSPVSLNDSRLIAELFQAFLLNKSALKSKMQRLADEDAKILQKTLIDAISSNFKNIIIATHVPPFPESCWHKGKQSDKNWLPYFTSKATGDVFFEIAKNYPNVNFQVLCGHTHSGGSVKIFGNLNIKAGNAQYYLPEIQEIIYS